MSEARMMELAGLVSRMEAEAEELRERAERAEATLNSITGMERTRLAELKFKEGFDAGIAHQKKAGPPPKARELKLLLVELAAAAEAYIAARPPAIVPYEVLKAARLRYCQALVKVPR